MKFKLTLLFNLIVSTYGKEQNDFIFNYFVFKKPSTVVGFTCNNDKENLQLARQFNKLGIRMTFDKLNNQAKVHQLLSTSNWRLGIFFDLRCFQNSKIKLLFVEAFNYRLYGEMHHWLILSANVQNMTRVVDDRAFGLSTDFVLAVPSPKYSDTLELYDMYNPWKIGGGQLNVIQIGTWSKVTGLRITLPQSKIMRRSNMHGMIMRASFFASKYRPKSMDLERYLEEYTIDSKDGLSKFGYTVLIHFSEMFNITMKFGEVQKRIEGDTEGPLIRALKNNEIEITGSPIIMTIERLDITKFVYPTWPFRTCFIFRNPQPKYIKIDEVLRPFEVESWYLTMAVFIIIIAILALTFRYEEKEISFTPYSNALFVTIGAVCQQGTNFDVKKISTRIMFINVLIFSMLIYNYYSASIVSVRLNEPIFKINDSLTQLAKTDLKLSSEPIIDFDFLIRKQDWETKTFYKNRWLQIPKSEQFMYPEKGMELVQQGGFAYHTHPDVGYPIIHRTYSYREICELMEVHIQSPVLATMAVPYNSSFVEIAKIGFARMSEVGIRHRQVMRWTSRKPQCRKDILNVSSTDIYEFAPYLLILLGGLALSIIIFFFEIATARCQQNKRSSSRKDSFIIELLRKLK